MELRAKVIEAFRRTGQIDPSAFTEFGYDDEDAFVSALTEGDAPVAVYDPCLKDGQWVFSEWYASGRIYEKLIALESFKIVFGENKSAFYRLDVNERLLKERLIDCKVVLPPRDITPPDVYAQLCSRVEDMGLYPELSQDESPVLRVNLSNLLVTTDLFIEFLNFLGIRFSVDQYAQIDRLHPRGVSWSLKGSSQWTRYGGSLRDDQIFHGAVDGGCFHLRKRPGEDPDEYNQRSSLYVQEIERLNVRFEEWVFADVDRAWSLVTRCLDRFPQTAEVKWFWDAPPSSLSEKIQLRPVQVKAIEYGLFNLTCHPGRGTFLLHEVGVGKTLEMACTLVAAKEAGLCKKPVIATPKNVSGKMLPDLQQSFPSLKVIGVFDKRSAHLLEGDFDLAVVSHEIAQSAIVPDEDCNLCDAFYFDEAHKVRKHPIQVPKRWKGAKGIPSDFSKRSIEIAKIFDRLLSRSCFAGWATGTFPVNSILEIWVAFRFLDSEGAKKVGVYDIGEFLSYFGQVDSTIEFDYASGVQEVPRLSSFWNFWSLQDLIRNWVFPCTADEAGVPRPKFNQDEFSCPMPPHGDEFATQMAAWRHLLSDQSLWSRDKSGNPIHPYYVKEGFKVELNPLAIVGQGRDNAISPLLVNPNSEESSDSKLSQAAAAIYRLWEASSHFNGVQLIFCNSSAPKGDGPDALFSPQAYLRNLLEAMGVPRNEVHFIHDYSFARQKDLEKEVRSGSGKVRILFLSADKGGTGCNWQDYAFAMHLLDVPYTPDVIVQMIGRIFRQGNRCAEILVFSYFSARENGQPGFEAFLASIVEGKLSALEVLYNLKRINVVENCDVTGNIAQIAAAATGNMTVIEAAETEHFIRKLESEISAKSSQLAWLDHELKDLQDKLPALDDDRLSLKANASFVGRMLNGEDFIQVSIKGKIFKGKEALAAIHMLKGPLRRLKAIEPITGASIEYVADHVIIRSQENIVKIPAHLDLAHELKQIASGFSASAAEERYQTALNRQNELPVAIGELTATLKERRKQKSLAEQEYHRLRELVLEIEKDSSIPVLVGSELEAPQRAKLPTSFTPAFIEAVKRLNPRGARSLDEWCELVRTMAVDLPDRLPEPSLPTPRPAAGPIRSPVSTLRQRMKGIVPKTHLDKMIQLALKALGVTTKGRKPSTHTTTATGDPQPPSRPRERTLVQLDLFEWSAAMEALEAALTDMGFDEQQIKVALKAVETLAPKSRSPEPAKVPTPSPKISEPKGVTELIDMMYRKVVQEHEG